MTEENKQAQAGDAPKLGILRIYLKDVSFETPNSPAVFTQEFKPEVKLQLSSRAIRLEKKLYEVQLDVTVTASQAEKTGFLVEIQQAGIFHIDASDEGKRNEILGIRCPRELFPFAREAICDLVVKGGFPQLLLAPVNFKEVYLKKMAQAASSEASPEAVTP